MGSRLRHGDSQRGRGPSGARVAAGGALLTAVLCVAAFEGTRKADFVQDDVPIIRDNPIVHRADLREIFATHYWEGVRGEDESVYRPIAMLSHVLDRGPDGRVPAARAHAVNVLLHLAVALALGALALRLGAGPWAASIAAAIFAVHPVHTAPVAGIVGRSEVLAGLFTVAALLAQTYSGPWGPSSDPEAPGSPATRRLGAWGAALFTFLAAGSKETGFLTLVLLVVLELLYRPRRGAPWVAWTVDRAGALAPSVLASVLCLVARIYALEAFPGVQRLRLYDNPLTALDGIERAATALAIAWRYAVLFVWPSRLSADYSGNAVSTETSLLAARPLAGLLFLGALAVLAALPFWLRLRRGRADSTSAQEVRLLAAAFGAWIFLVPYAVIGNLLFLIGNAMAERFVYVPSLGLCLSAAVLAMWAIPASGPAAAPLRRAAAALLIAAIASMTWRTRSAVRDWRDDRSLFEASMRAVPTAARPPYVLARMLIDEGREEEAWPLIERTLELWPRTSGALVDKARILARRGDSEGAVAALREACIQNPWLPEAGIELARGLTRLGRPDEAERVLTPMTRRFSGLVAVWVELGELYRITGRPRDAAAAWRRAIALGRTDLESRIRDLSAGFSATPDAAPPGPGREAR